MSDELLDNYVDRGAVKGDGDFLRSELKSLLDLFNQLSEFKLKLNTDNSWKEAAATQAALKKATDELSAASKEYQSAQDQVIKNQVKLNQTQTDTAKTIAGQKLALQQANTELKTQAQLSAAAQGSINQLRASLALLTKQYDALSASERNSASGNALQTQIQQVDKALKTLEGDTGRSQRSVGDYVGALKTLKPALAEVKQKLDDLTKTGKTNTDEFSQLTSEYDLLDQVLGRQSQGFASLTQEVRTTERQLATMAAAGLKGTETFKQLQTSVASSKRNLQEFNEQQKLLSSQTPILSSLTLAAKGLAGAYAIGAGASALFADGDEKVQKELNKLVAIMTVLQGLQEAHQLLEKSGAIAQIASAAATKIQTAAMAVYTFVTEGATIATQVFRAALISTGLGGIIILLSSFASKMSEVKEQTEKDIETQIRLNEALKAYNELLVKSNQELVDQLNQRKKLSEDALALDEKAGLTQNELLERKKQIAFQDNYNAKEAIRNLQIQGQATTGLSKYYNGLTSSVDDFKVSLERIKAREDELTNALKVQQIVRASVISAGSKDDDDEVKAIDNKIKLLTAEDDRLKLITDQGKKLVDQYANSAQAVKELNAEQQKFNTEDQNKRVLETEKIRQTTISDSNKTVLDADQVFYTTRLHAAGAYTNAEIAIVRAQRNFDLSDNTLSENQRIVIKAKANAEIVKLENALVVKLIQIRGAYIAQVRDDEAKINAEFIAFVEQQQTAALKAIVDRGSISKAFLEQGRDSELQALDRRYALEIEKAGENVDKLKKVQEKYQVDRKAIENRGQVDLLTSQAANIDSQIELLKKEGKSTIDLETQKSAILVQINDLKNEKLYDSELRAAEKRQQLRDKEVEAEKTLQDSLVSVIDSSYDRQKNAIQSQIDIVNQQKEAQIAAENATSDSAQVKADKITVITANAASQAEALQRKQKQLDLDKAKFDKANAILHIGINTAEAVSKDLIGNKALIPYDLAIGAAEIAAVAASTVPTYGDGTEDHPGGKAYVGDKRKSELAIFPDGRIYRTPSKTTLVDMPAHTVVMPDADRALREMQYASFHNVPVIPHAGNNNRDLIREYRQQTNRTIQAIENKPTAIIKNTFSGWDVSFRNGQRWYSYVNRNTQS